MAARSARQGPGAGSERSSAGEAAARSPRAGARRSARREALSLGHARVLRVAEEFREVMDRVFTMMSEDPDMGPQAARRRRSPALRLHRRRHGHQHPRRAVGEEGNLHWEWSDDVDWEPKVQMAMSTETANRYFQGKENVAMAIARRRIKTGGDVKAALSLIPITKPIYARYRALLGAEYPHLAYACRRCPSEPSTQHRRGGRRLRPRAVPARRRSPVGRDGPVPAGHGGRCDSAPLLAHAAPDRRAAARSAGTRSRSIRDAHRSTAGSPSATSRTSSRPTSPAYTLERGRAGDRAGAGADRAHLRASGFSTQALERAHRGGRELLRYVAAVLAAGFPLVAFLQLVRVYGQAIAQIADAEVRLFHLYVHEPLMRDGVARAGDGRGDGGPRARAAAARLADHGPRPPALPAALHRAGRDRAHGGRPRGRALDLGRAARGDRVRRPRRATRA